MAAGGESGGKGGMAEADLTPWFDATTQYPARKGWYDVKYDGYPGIIRQYWSGNVWRGECLYVSSIGCWQGDKWRGLRKPTK